MNSANMNTWSWYWIEWKRILVGSWREAYSKILTANYALWNFCTQTCGKYIESFLLMSTWAVVSWLMFCWALSLVPHKGQGLSHWEEILNFCLKLVSFTLVEDDFFFCGMKVHELRWREIQNSHSSSNVSIFQARFRNWDDDRNFQDISDML